MGLSTSSETRPLLGRSPETLSGGGDEAALARAAAVKPSVLPA